MYSVINPQGDKSSCQCLRYPASRGFSRASPFSMYIVVRVSGISRCKQARHANDNVYAKVLAVEKPLLAGYVLRRLKKSKLNYHLPDNRLNRYQNALRRSEEIGSEMQQDYQSDNSVHFKRLAKEPGALPEAKKSLKVW